MKHREFLMQAHTYSKQDVGGFFISEKLDGARCFWDGGVSRGLPTKSIPWANIHDPKTGRLKSKIKPESTGLWSRYGNPIMAPDWWLNQLPCIPLDGELWAGRGNFQTCMSICKKDSPSSSEWAELDYAIIGSPPFAAIFMDGTINNANFKLDIKYETVSTWLDTLPRGRVHDYRYLPAGITFDRELINLQKAVPSEGRIYLLQQKKLPLVGSAEAVERELERILKLGGEGIVLRDPQSTWLPKRLHTVLKYKPYKDAEGTLIGFTAGRGKYTGMIGALILDYKGKRLELSGITDDEREFHKSPSAESIPGKDMPKGTKASRFTVGESITFKYRELSDDGTPKEARYFRPRGVE